MWDADITAWYEYNKGGATGGHTTQVTELTVEVYGGIILFVYM